jgi:hypothetical protein
VGLIIVSAPLTCGWAAVSHAPWITITAGAAGTGNANVSYAVAANTVMSPRTGTISVGGRTYTVNQAAASCSYSFAPGSQAVAHDGGNYAVDVTTLSGCSWTATSNVPWITVSNPGSHNGNATVSYTVAPNAGSFTRSGSLTIGNRLFSISQSSSSCSVAVGPSSLTVSFTGAEPMLSVSTGPTCAWTASSNVSWITVLTTSGTGGGLVTIRVAPNPDAASRIGTVIIGGTAVTVTQNGTGAAGG